MHNQKISNSLVILVNFLLCCWTNYFMWTLHRFLDYFFLESEVESKTGSVTALLYTEETVQDELCSSWSISLPITKQVRQKELCMRQKSYSC